jgi:hypothetical protein
MPWVGFEPTIPASERAKTVHALDRSKTVDFYSFGFFGCFYSLTLRNSTIFFRFLFLWNYFENNFVFPVLFEIFLFYVKETRIIWFFKDVLNQFRLCRKGSLFIQNIKSVLILYVVFDSILVLYIEQRSVMANSFNCVIVWHTHAIRKWR